MKNIDNIDQLFEDSLENLELTPSSHVKQQIQKRLFWHNLFSRKKGLLMMILLGLIITPFVYEIASGDAQSSSINSSTDKSTVLQASESNLLPQKENIIKSNKPKNNNEQLLATNINTEKNQASENSIDNEIRNTNINNELTEKPAGNRKTLENINSASSALPQAKHKINAKNKKDINLLPVVSAQQSAVISEQITVSSNSSKSKVLETKPTESITVMPSLVCKALDYYPAEPKLSLPDDTVGFNIFHEAIVLPSNRWILGVNVSPNYSFSSIANSNNEDYALAPYNQNSLSPTLSYALGIELWYQFKQLKIGTGLSYAKYAQDISLSENVLDLKDVAYWDYYQTEHWNITQTPYINIDSLMQGDTTIIYQTDSTAYFINDSTQKYRTDTSWTQEEYQKRNLYSYVEIPLIAEYAFNREKTWQPFVAGGLVTGIYIKTQSYYLKNEHVVASQILPYSRFAFWAHLSLGMRYQFNKKISFSASVYYRYHLNSILDDQSYFKQSLDNVSFKLGAYYHF